MPNSFPECPAFRNFGGYGKSFEGDDAHGVFD